MSPMRNLSTRLARIPQGAALLFFIQIFATLGYAVLYSSLVLYATEKLRFVRITPHELSGRRFVFGPEPDHGSYPG